MITDFLVVSLLVLLVNAQLARTDGVRIVDNDIVNGVEGEDYSFQCEYTQTDINMGAPELHWENSMTVRLLSGAKYDIVNTKNESLAQTVSVLTIKNAERRDSMDYYCVSDTSRAIVTLNIVPTATVKVVDVSGDFSLAVGTTIGCNVDGDSSANVTWTLNNKPLRQGKQDLNNDNEMNIEVTNNRFVKLLTDGPEVTGIYACVFDLGKGLTETDSVVIAEDIIMFLNPSIKVTEGETGEMVCRAKSSPLPVITWYYQNGTKVTDIPGKIELSEKMSKEEDEVIRTVIIKDVQLADLEQPYFNCSATNGAKTMVEAILLRIRGRYEALWPFIGIISEVVILIIIILLHEMCTSGADVGEVEDDEEDHLIQKTRSITRDGDRETRMRGTNN